MAAKRRIRRYSALTIVALLVALGLQWHQSHRPLIEGQVVDVLDGDTIDVIHEGKKMRVRLYGVDAPEKGQPFGKAARDYTRNACEDAQVKIKVVDSDRYERSVCWVILPDESTLNAALVKSGNAWCYRRYCKDESLPALEDEARRARRGLWSKERPTPPWEYRASHRKEKDE